MDALKWRCEPTLRLVGLLVLALAAVAPAQEAPTDLKDVQTTIEALKARIRDLENRVGEQESQNTQAARAEEVRKICQERNADMGKGMSFPKWMDDLTFYGDLRLRYQGECFSGEDRDEKTRHRGRFRLRVGLKKTWLDGQVEAAFQLASGDQSGTWSNESDPTSTNQTFDNAFSGKHVWIDRAYARYKPNWAKGLELIGGKFGVPWVHTDMVWDSDVNVEGVWGGYARKLADGRLEPFAGMGFMVVEENSSGRDATLHVYQAGVNWAICKDVKYTFAATYYDFDDFENQVRAVRGNSGARGFQMINVTNQIGWQAFGRPMSAWFDSIHNCEDKAEAAAYDDQSDGFAVGMKVGRNKKARDWSVAYKYACIEANCTPGQFSGSDFGFANRKGHRIGGAYNITDFLTAAVAVFYTEPVTASNEDQRDVTVQADLVWKF